MGQKINLSLVLILILSGFLYFFQLGAPSVWDQDEGQMLASSLEMVKSGDFLTPHLNSSIYFHKPPLYAWLTALFFKLFGFTEFGGRFWAAIFGLAGVFLTYRFGKELYNERVGLLSALVLATCPLYIVLSKMGLVDVVLTFFITLSLYLFCLGLKDPSHKKWFYLFYLSLALGVMTKGPLGIILPGLAILIYLLIERRLNFIREMAPVIGTVIFLTVASPWFVIETILHGSYFLKTIFGQFLFAIYLSPLQQHEGPVWFYLPVILIGLLPWSGLFLPALFRKPHTLLLTLLGVMLLIFSTAFTKVPGYFLPAFPAMAIMTAALLDKIFEGQYKWAFYFGLIFPLLVLALTLWATFQAQIPAEYAQALIYLQTLILVGLTGLFLAFLFSFNRSQPAWSIGAWVFTVSVFFIGLINWLLPFAENIKPTPDLAAALMGYQNIAFYRTWLPPSLIFYLNRQNYPTISVDLQDEKSLSKFLNKPRSACYISIDEAKKLKLAFKVVKRKSGFEVIRR